MKVEGPSIHFLKKTRASSGCVITTQEEEIDGAGSSVGIYILLVIVVVACFFRQPGVRGVLGNFYYGGTKNKPLRAIANKKKNINTNRGKGEQTRGAFLSWKGLRVTVACIGNVTVLQWY